LKRKEVAETFLALARDFMRLWFPLIIFIITILKLQFKNEISGFCCSVEEFSVF
jgi:hypothetical protein